MFGTGEGEETAYGSRENRGAPGFTASEEGARKRINLQNPVLCLSAFLFLILRADSDSSDIRKRSCGNGFRLFDETRPRNAKLRKEIGQIGTFLEEKKNIFRNRKKFQKNSLQIGKNVI